MTNQTGANMRKKRGRGREDCQPGRADLSSRARKESSRGAKREGPPLLSTVVTAPSSVSSVRGSQLKATIILPFSVNMLEKFLLRKSLLDKNTDEESKFPSSR